MKVEKTFYTTVFMGVASGGGGYVPPGSKYWGHPQKSHFLKKIF